MKPEDPPAEDLMSFQKKAIWLRMEFYKRKALMYEDLFCGLSELSIFKEKYVSVQFFIVFILFLE